MKDSRLEDIAGPAIIISDEKSARTEINLENVVCQRVPILASFRESGKRIAGAGSVYSVKALTHGLQIADLGGTPEIRTTFETAELKAMPALVKSDIPALPPADAVKCRRRDRERDLRRIRVKPDQNGIGPQRGGDFPVSVTR